MTRDAFMEEACRLAKESVDNGWGGPFGAVVTRVLGFWLVPGRQASRARLDFTGAAISICFLTIAALVFWLCTTQIWHLP
jgi:hypothetical protein